MRSKAHSARELVRQGCVLRWGLRHAGSFLQVLRLRRVALVLRAPWGDHARHPSPGGENAAHRGFAEDVGATVACPTLHEASGKQPDGRYGDDGRPSRQSLGLGMGFLDGDRSLLRNAGAAAAAMVLNPKSSRM